MRCFNLEAEALFETHGAQNACWIIHEAVGMQHTDQAFLQVALAAIEIHQLAPTSRVPDRWPVY